MRFLAIGEMVENRIRVGTGEITRLLSVRVGEKQNQSRESIENLFLYFTLFL